MTQPTVTLPTEDSGDIALSEPLWCVGHADHRPGYAADLCHAGPLLELLAPTRRGDVVAMDVQLVRYPLAEISHRDLYAHVTIGGHGYECAPGDLEAIAAALVEHAAQLRAFGGELARLITRGEGQ